MTAHFTESDGFGTITIKSDTAKNPDVFSFEFSGIPASVPKAITGEISLLFSLFSDEIPKKIESLDKENFRILEVADEKGNELSEVFFSESGYDYHITYDTRKGYPHSMSAGNDALSVSIEFKDFKQTTI